MTNPTLLVIAGCNGSGKSSFSNALTPDHVTPFDYDKHFLRFYNNLIESELRVNMAHNLARELLVESIEKSIMEKQEFCYETNFDSNPMYWPDYFKKYGYVRNIFFFCLDSIYQAKKRVRIRVENGGHFVSDSEIKKRVYKGYEKLDLHFTEFDNVHLFNSSFYNKEPQHILSIRGGKIVSLKEIPAFLKKLAPKITKLQ